MRNKRIGKWIARLLAAVLLIALLPAPAAFAASNNETESALNKTFDYYRTRQAGALGSWEALAAACISGADLAEYSLPQAAGPANTSALIALMRGDMAGAKGFAEALADKDLKEASYAYGDALDLIAVEAYNRAAASDAPDIYNEISYDKNEALNHLLSAKEEDGGFGYGSGGDPDATGLVLAALAPFNNTSYRDVQAAVSGALAYLKKVQEANGGFSAWSLNNASSAAAVLWGLCALKEDIGSWAKDGKTPVDALLSFQTPEGGFGITDNVTVDPAFATPQAALALAQIKSGKTFFTDFSVNAASYKNLSAGVVTSDGKYTERAFSVKNGEKFSDALKRALTTTAAVTMNDYFCCESGAPAASDDLSGLADGAALLAIHKNFKHAVYFETDDKTGFGVNEIDLAFGESATLRLMRTSSGAISVKAPLAGIDIDADGDGVADGTTDADGRVTLGFVNAGAHSVVALRGSYVYDSGTGSYVYKEAIGADAAVLPARVTMRAAGAAQTAKVSVRAEGPSENILFWNPVTVGNSGEKVLTVLDAVKEALRRAEAPYNADGGYFSSINGVAGGVYGGWDGWLCAVNGVLPSVGMAAQPIEDGDEIVVYYGDYSETLFPEVSASRSADGSVTLTVRERQGSAGAASSPAKDVSVFWAEHTVSAFTGVTDGSGTLVVPASKAPLGRHTLRISKTREDGLPLIVRLAPGYTVELTREGASSSVPEGATQEIYVKVTGPEGTLFARKGFPWFSNATPLSMLSLTKLPYETDAARAYVKSIGGIEEFDYGANSGWLYKVNGIETIRESSAEYKLNAGDELEWFYTRDYTKESGSSAWTAAPAAEEDGAKAAVLRPEAEAAAGAAAITLRDEDVKKVVAEALRGNAKEIVIEPKIKGEAGKVSVALSAASARGIANDAKARLTLKTALGDVSVRSEGLAALAEEVSAALTLSIEREADIVSAEVSVDGKAAARVAGGVKLRLPVPEKPGSGTVALRLRDDGSEEIILLSAALDGDLVAVLDGSARVRAADRSRAFADVGENTWFKDDADFVSARELFRGTGEDEFSGALPMTRAMLVSVFHRLAGSPAAEGSAFPDVSEAAWYREAAAWAAAAGVMRGMDGGFAGNLEITREQLAAAAMRFAESVGADMGEPAALTGFTDHSAVSAWAEEAAAWAVGAGLLKGDESRRLNAGDAAARAEVAAVMRRFVEGLIRAS
jgi:uncharacterized cupredoxin-like copper-binding protein